MYMVGLYDFLNGLALVLFWGDIMLRAEEGRPSKANCPVLSPGSWSLRRGPNATVSARSCRESARGVLGKHI